MKDPPRNNAIVLNCISGDVHEVYEAVKSFGDVCIIKTTRKTAIVDFVNIYDKKTVEQLVQELKQYDAVKFCDRKKPKADILLCKSEIISK